MSLPVDHGVEAAALFAGRLRRLRRGLVLIATLGCSAALHAEESWFDDVEKYTLLSHARIDVAGPEPASFTALGVAPFLTAQALASSEFAFSAAQILDDQGQPHTALGIDLAPLTLTDSKLDLAAYQTDRRDRFLSRIQLSAAVSKGEGGDDRSTRFAPTLRFVLHEQRDPRVHRGPGSLRDCFARRVPPPEADRARQAQLLAAMQAIEATLRDSTASALNLREARSQYEQLQSQWQMGEVQYLAVLKETVRQGMQACRDDPEVAAYTWNATGHAIGLAPTFRNSLNGDGAIRPRGFVVFGTTAYGFDTQGTQSSYVPSFLGRHAQVLGQVLLRTNEPLSSSRTSDVSTSADQLAVSARLRGGTSPFNANLEAALLHDWLRNGDGSDSYYKLAAGSDLHLNAGLWASFSIGRTFSRGLSSNETTFGISLKRSLLQ